MVQKVHAKFAALFLLLCCIVINSAFAQSPVNQPKSPTTQTLETICKTSPSECLKHVNEALKKTQKNSRVYYRLLQFRFDSLFNLQRRKQLLRETELWLNKSDTPIAFRSSVYIYYAKAALFVGDKKSSKKYYSLALEMISLMNEASPSPMRLVVLANLQMQLKEFEQAHQLLSSLVKKYPNSPDTQFMMELHGNLAHASNQLGRYKEAVVHWQDTHKWSELFGNKQQIAVVLYNLADVHFTLGQYNKTEQNLINAIAMAQQADDIKKVNEAKLYLARVQLKLNKHCQAYINFISIDNNDLPVKHQPSFSEMNKKMKPC